MCTAFSKSVNLFSKFLGQVVPQATVANPSPLSFTPTSVMRKTAAERKDSDPRIHVPELKVQDYYVL